MHEDSIKIRQILAESVPKSPPTAVCLGGRVDASSQSRRDVWRVGDLVIDEGQQLVGFVADRDRPRFEFAELVVDEKRELDDLRRARVERPRQALHQRFGDLRR